MAWKRTTPQKCNNLNLKGTETKCLANNKDEWKDLFRYIYFIAVKLTCKRNSGTGSLKLILSLTKRSLYNKVISLRFCIYFS